MDIPRIQAHAQNLEEQQQPQRGERDCDRGYGKRFNRPTYSRPDQSFMVSGSQYRGDPSHIRPPVPRCTQCGRLNLGQCLLGSDACYGCGQPSHVVQDCPSRGGRSRVQPIGSADGSSSSVRPLGQGSQAPAGRGRGREGASSSSGPQNRIYALAGRHDLESSPDVVTSILSVCSHDVYPLIYPSSTLSYITSYIAKRIGAFPGSISNYVH
ncbi:uncharacterized protein LOC132607886 [Lycium barbarum]|uniref:uncharacterized protein LOC132607886 n=1 Tax=Lycium barbarum TaxID=112863 RepID=UPI00293ECF4E|nr:uncharacterized protein LOC132607886 [Lycium barbarum]